MTTTPPTPADIKAGEDALEARYDDLIAKISPSEVQRHMVGYIAELLGIDNIVWMDDAAILKILDTAQDNGTDIPAHERHNLLTVDLALHATAKETHKPEYLVIEFANTVTPEDTHRIRRNADLLYHITGRRTRALVVGNYMPQLTWVEIAQDGIHIIQPYRWDPTLD